MKNKLIIAGAGSGKTTFIVKESMKIKNDRILITTFTEANSKEIKKKFIELNGFIPSNIVIQTWFSFLLEHGVRPYQNYIVQEKIEGMLLVNRMSGVKAYNRKVSQYIIQNLRIQKNIILAQIIKYILIKYLNLCLDVMRKPKAKLLTDYKMFFLAYL